MACTLARDAAREASSEWKEAVKTAREAEQKALQDLKRTEDSRRQDLIRMDALINDTQELAKNLSEHQHVAKDLNLMIQRHENSLSRPGSPARSVSSLGISAPMACITTPSRDVSPDRESSRRLSPRLRVS